jgi:hypothetical protein
MELAAINRTTERCPAEGTLSRWQGPGQLDMSRRANSPAGAAASQRKLAERRE